MAVADQDLLDAVDAQILALVTGGAQAVSARDRGVTKLSLQQLYDLKRDLETRIQASADAASGGGGNVLVQFGEPQ